METFAKCPHCKGSDSIILGTTNKWKLYCPECDIRFSYDDEIRPTDYYKLEKQENEDVP